MSPRTWSELLFDITNQTTAFSVRIFSLDTGILLVASEVDAVSVEKILLTTSQIQIFVLYLDHHGIMSNWIRFSTARPPTWQYLVALNTVYLEFPREFTRANWSDIQLTSTPIWFPPMFVCVCPVIKIDRPKLFRYVVKDWFIAICILSRLTRFLSGAHLLTCKYRLWNRWVIKSTILCGMKLPIYALTFGGSAQKSLKFWYGK